MFSLLFSCGGCTTRILSHPILTAALAYTLRRICRQFEPVSRLDTHAGTSLQVTAQDPQQLGPVCYTLN